MQYVQRSKIDSPALGCMYQAQEWKRRAWSRLRHLRAAQRTQWSGARSLEILRAEEAHNEAQAAERNAKAAIEKRANELGLTTCKRKSSK